MGESQDTGGSLRAAAPFHRAPRLRVSEALYIKSLLFSETPPHNVDSDFAWVLEGLPVVRFAAIYCSISPL